MKSASDAVAVRMRLPAAVLLLSALALAGCSSGGDHGASVALSNNKFDPTTLTVDAGEEVHFEVKEGSHTVTIHKAGDPTTSLLKDASVSAGDDEHFTFAAAGTYHVWCTIHGEMTSGMAMVVTVE